MSDVRQWSSGLGGASRGTGPGGSRHVVVVDHYDSFTYNLVQYLEVLGARCTVVQSERVTPATVLAGAPDAVLLSPGPGSPEEAGGTLPLIGALAGRVPLLGVCLGHQAIAVHFGATVVRAKRLMHGRTSPVLHDGRSVFRSLPSPFTAARYHSLAVDPARLPGCLEATARAPDGELMGLRHRELPVEGIQFHPESIASTHGLALLRNWLELL